MGKGGEGRGAPPDFYTIAHPLKSLFMYRLTCNMVSFHIKAVKTVDSILSNLDASSNYKWTAQENCDGLHASVSNIPLNTGGISRHISRISVEWGIPSWYIAEISRETFVTPWISELACFRLQVCSIFAFLESHEKELLGRSAGSFSWIADCNRVHLHLKIKISYRSFFNTSFYSFLRLHRKGRCSELLAND